MRKRILLGTAALLAGVAMASAQTMPQGGTSERQPGMSGQSGAQAPQLQQQGGGESQEQRGAQQRQEQRGAQQRQEPAQDRTTGQAQRESEPGQGAQSQQRDAQPQRQQEPKQDRTTGQAQRESEPRRDAQPSQRDAQPQRQQERTQDRARTQDRGTQQQAGTRADAQGRVNLSADQRTRIQQTVFASANLPRVSRVDFALGVGTVIPTHVTIVDVPSALIEINPVWRGHKFFVVEEDIVIVSPERRIVAVLPVGRARASGGGAVVADLPPEEIRIIQQVLIDRGFDVELDGVFGPRTRSALIAFQRREGLQATGRIDTRTVTALGVRDRVKVQGDTGTVGSGPAGQTGAAGQADRQQRGTAGQGAQQQPQQRETSGQGGDAKQQPQQRETSGQGGDAKQQPQQRETSGQGGDAKQQPQQRETSGQGGDAQQKQQRSGGSDRSPELQKQPDSGQSPSGSGGSSKY
jgi:peptidoglycan hydrolase-like protein with peptidoglycan-binding domain